MKRSVLQSIVKRNSTQITDITNQIEMNLQHAYCFKKNGHKYLCNRSHSAASKLRGKLKALVNIQQELKKELRYF